MKKAIALLLALVCLLTLAGCDRKSMNYIIQNEPSIPGIVRDTTENAILIENEDGEYWVSLDVENGDSMTHSGSVMRWWSISTAASRKAAPCRSTGSTPSP